MRIFHCDHCRQAVFFENTWCGRCGHKLAYLPDLKLVASLDAVGASANAAGAPPSAESGAEAMPAEATQLWTSPVPGARGRAYRLCRNNSVHHVCNWAVPQDDPSPLCSSCRLTTIIPDLSQPQNQGLWFRMETAKRRLVYSLMEFNLPLRAKAQDPAKGLAFRFMSDPSGGPTVLTGHDNGIITVNIAEADDVERERRRTRLHEPYRTLLGNFRHEIGHYYWDLLIKESPRLGDFRRQFGDETANYDNALKQHYEHGPASDWPQRFLSSYASVHPWEDWAETWAHYLHMTDTLETAAVCGLSLQPDRPDEPAMPKQTAKPAHEQTFDEIIDNWFPLTYALNSLNRGMGLPDAYPFVLPQPAIDKLRFVHETICHCNAPDSSEVTERPAVSQHEGEVASVAAH
jgi:hypothetical protein